MLGDIIIIIEKTVVRGSCGKISRNFRKPTRSLSASCKNRRFRRRLDLLWVKNELEKAGKLWDFACKLGVVFKGSK